MKIGFDVHGTIDKNPEVFKPMMKALLKVNHEICIISGPPKDQILKELKKLGLIENYHYRKIYSVVDFLLKYSDAKMIQDEKGHWWCEDYYWWESKGEICNYYNVEVIYDNEIKYSYDMPNSTKFLYWKET